MFLYALTNSWVIKHTGVNPESKCIIVFWHGQMLPGWKFFRRLSPYAVISKSKDGQALADILSGWGYKFIRGSSSSGGKETLADITEKAKTSTVIMTPDGPKGPTRKFKAGAVVAAQRSGAPLYLCGIKIEHKKIFRKSWDRFELPLPLSKVWLQVEGPYYIPPEAKRKEIEFMLKEYEEALNSLSS
jgi:lysophospholipid acyltransferase (LPLAT)-like uncharacterized protein